MILNRSHADPRSDHAANAKGLFTENAKGLFTELM